MIRVIYQYQPPVLMYHKFLPDGEECTYPYHVTSKNFEEQLRYLKENGYETIFFSEIENVKNMNKKKYIILTADDGYRDNYEVMFPLLKKYNMKMNIFLISGKSYNSWDCEDLNPPYPKYDLMENEHIHEMLESGLVEFGVHGKNHKYLPKISEGELVEEIIGAKKELEEKLGLSMIAMAYPYGGYNHKVREIVEKSGLSYACATGWGSVVFCRDPFTIRRIEIEYSDNLEKFKRKVSGYYNHKLEGKENIKRFIKKKILGV